MENTCQHELQAIRQRQGKIHEEVAVLDAQIDSLSRRITAMSAGSTTQSAAQTGKKRRPEPSPRPKPSPPPRPQPKRAGPSGNGIPPMPRAGAALSRLRESAASVFGEGLELHFGKIWLAPLGILLVLTGMVFLAHYAYNHFIIEWGPFARSLVVLALSGTLTAVGMVIERRRPAMKRFGQVLSAGGMAGVFYALYASHHVEALQWIGSPILAGILLLGWTTVMGWTADRRRSELFAGLALLLTFYTVVVTPITGFTLVANLILALGALFFLLRRGWSRLSLAAMPLTYGAFGFWQLMYRDGNLGLAWPPEAELFPLAALFLSAYWLVFTTAVLLPRRALMAPGLRAAFAGINNIGFFMLGALSFPKDLWDHFWLWPLGLGVVLLGLAYAARARMPQRDELARVFCAEGLILLTLGVILKVQGPNLALLLAAQSAMLLAASRFHWPKWYQAWSSGVATLATLTAFAQLTILDWSAGGIALVVAVIVAGEGFFLADRRPTPRRLRIWPLFHSLLSLGLVCGTILAYAMPDDRPLLLGAVAVGLALPLRRHRFREIVVAAVPLLAIAHFGWLLRIILNWDAVDHSLTVLLLAMTMVYGQFWLRQTVLTLRPALHHAFQAWLAAAETAFVFMLIDLSYFLENWFWLAPLLFFATVAKANFLGSAWSALAAHYYSLTAFGIFLIYGFQQMLPGESALPSPAQALLLPVSFCGIQLLARFIPWPWRGTDDAAESLDVWRAWRRATLAVYPWITAGIFVLWTFLSIDPLYRTLFFGGAGLVLGVGTSLFQRKFLYGLSLALGGLALAQFCGNGLFEVLTGWDLAGILAVVALHTLTRLMDEWDWGLRLPRTVQILFAGFAVLQALWFITDKVRAADADFALTMAWGLLGAAVFALGFWVKDRLYRWWGLALLVLSLGKLLFYDLWQLGAEGRIVSCLALGALLVTLGFLYNRFSEKLREVF